LKTHVYFIEAGICLLLTLLNCLASISHISKDTAFYPVLLIVLKTMHILTTTMKPVLETTFNGRPPDYL